MIVTIIGLGLIGGSLGLDLKANGFADHVIGVDSSEEHGETALALELVDEILPIEEAVKKSNLVVLATPVNALIKLLPTILDLLPEDCFVTDMGSTKAGILAGVKNHPRRSLYVAAHPMAGTENSGPEAAIPNLFNRKAVIICDRERSKAEAKWRVEKMFKSLFMRILYMEGAAHDVHAAYVSHISHISSFLLANTVLEKEKSEANIFNLASGGFDSTVRLAKSSPKMWADIFEQNSENVLEVLTAYIENLTEFRDLMANNDYEQLFQRMEEANKIRKILE